MADLEFVKQQLQLLGFNSGVVERYNEPHRHYHTLEHLLDVVNELKLHQKFDVALFLSAVYHDAVYNPKATDNEEQSAALFELDAKSARLDSNLILRVIELILSTKHLSAANEKTNPLVEADLKILSRPFAELLDYEHKIFKEYQFVNYTTYLNSRLEVLNKLNSGGDLDRLIEYVRHRKPLIGVFAGSFNPFHKGHYNVLQKAEKIFDKVIVAFGKNPEKGQREWAVPQTIQNRQIEEYNGLLTDFIQSLGHDVVVVRGLRNSTDFQYEQNQYRYIQELMPGIKIINIFCDKEFEHISSSGIRTLEKFGRHQGYLLD